MYIHHLQAYSKQKTKKEKKNIFNVNDKMIHKATLNPLVKKKIIMYNGVSCPGIHGDSARSERIRRE